MAPRGSGRARPRSGDGGAGLRDPRTGRGAERSAGLTPSSASAAARSQGTGPGLRIGQWHLPLLAPGPMVACTRGGRAEGGGSGAPGRQCARAAQTPLRPGGSGSAVGVLDSMVDSGLAGLRPGYGRFGGDSDHDRKPWCHGDGHGGADARHDDHAPGALPARTSRRPNQARRPSSVVRSPSSSGLSAGLETRSA